MPKGRWPTPSSAPGGSAPSAGTGSPSGGVPGTGSPPRPAQPTTPAQPAAPGQEAAPAQPASPAQPATPAQPTSPGQQAAPGLPAAPSQEAAPARLASPARPAAPGQPTPPAQPAAPGQQAAWARAGLDPGAAEHLLADLVPFLPSPGYPQHAAHEFLVSVERAHRLSDGDPLGRPLKYLRLVTGPDRAFGQHPQVCAWPPGGSEPLYPVRLIQPRLEGDAGDPRAGDLDHGRADPPGLADQRTGDVEPGRGDVLAELPVAQLVAEPFHPPVQVLPGVGINGLLIAAVVLLVGVLVAGQPEHPQPDAAGDWPLVDGRPRGLTAHHQVGLRARVHRDHPCTRHSSHRIRLASRDRPAQLAR